MTAAEVDPAPAFDRAELRVVELASGLLMLLDQAGMTGRLPIGVRAGAARLRHAVKLAIQQTAHSPARLAPAPALDQGAQLHSWLANQPWAQVDTGPPGWCYLLCFTDPATGRHKPLQGAGPGGQYAGHYWGWTTDLKRRISQHRNPRSTGPGRLVQVALAAGLSFEVAYLEYPATRARERRLKAQGSAYRRCPLCRGTGRPLDPATAAAVIRARAAR